MAEELATTPLLALLVDSSRVVFWLLFVILIRPFGLITFEAESIVLLQAGLLGYLLTSTFLCEVIPYCLLLRGL